MGTNYGKKERKIKKNYCLQAHKTACLENNPSRRRIKMYFEYNADDNFRSIWIFHFFWLFGKSNFEKVCPSRLKFLLCQHKVVNTMLLWFLRAGINTQWCVPFHSRNPLSVPPVSFMVTHQGLIKLTRTNIWLCSSSLSNFCYFVILRSQFVFLAFIVFEHNLFFF